MTDIDNFSKISLESVTDAFGSEVKIGDFVAYAAKSWGQTRVRLGQVLKLTKISRPYYGRPYHEFRVQVVATNHKGRSYKQTWTDLKKLTLYKKSDLTTIGD